MICPICGDIVRVYYTKAETDCIRRKRKCVGCGFSFYTVEIDQDQYEKLLGRRRKQFSKGGVSDVSMR